MQKLWLCHNYITLRNLHQQLTYLIHEHDKSYIYIYVIISQQSFTLIKNEIKLIVHLEYKHQIYMYFRKNLINATDACKIERQINLGVFYPPWFKEDRKFQEEIASVYQAAILNRLRPAFTAVRHAL